MITNNEKTESDYGDDFNNSSQEIFAPDDRDSDDEEETEELPLDMTSENEIQIELAESDVGENEAGFELIIRPIQNE